MSMDIHNSNDPQDEEMERILRQATPRGADASLRPRVLAAVAREVGAPARFRWERIYWPAVAAAILLGVLLNYWVAVQGTARLAQIMGPPAVSRQAADVAADIAAITDEATGRWAYERLAASRRPPDPFARPAARLE